MNDRLVISNIVETLGRNGALKMDDLFKSVKKLHGDVERRFFEETLMVLELQGILRVYNISRGKSRVELVKG